MINTELQNNSFSGLKSIAACHELLEDALRLAKDKGATDAAIDYNQDIGFSVDVRLGNVEAISFHQNQGLGIDVYIGQSKGSASSTDLRYESVERAVQIACDMAKVSAHDPCYGLIDAEINSQSKDLDLFHPANLAPDTAIAQALQLEKLAMQQDKRISNSEGASIATYNFLSATMNTKGFNRVVYSTRHSMSCVLIAQSQLEMQRDYAFTTARDIAQLDEIETLAKLAATRVCARLQPKLLNTQEIPVVFSNRVSANLINYFISAISGSQLYRKNSFLCDAIGKQVFPDFVSIYEQPFIPKGLSSMNYDSDGSATRENIFVQNGVLDNYVLGVYSARRLGMQSTGNADGVHNLHVSANAKDLHELMAQFPKCFLVTELMGQGVQLLTGNYSQGASGFLVEHGAVIHAVEGVTIAGNLLDMYKDIIAVGNDRDHNRSTQCGSILIRSMMLAGQ